jgi:hypothetical protein
MRTVPLRGEVWFIDLGMVGKPRYALVLAARTDARLALASVVLIIRQFEDSLTRSHCPAYRGCGSKATSMSRASSR